MKSYLLLLILIVCSYTVHAQNSNSKDSIYICPPCGRDCDTIQFIKKGTCPYCGMTLIATSVDLFRQKLAEQKAHPKKDYTICFYLQNGVEVLDFAGPMEVFDAAGFKVFTVSRTREKILSQGILSILPDYSIQDAPPADILVFFGGETNTSTQDSALISWIRSRSKQSSYILSVCTGAFIIGKAGILDHKTATTYHSWIDGLQTALPATKVLRNVRFVDNGNVITTAGVSAGIDGALYLVEKLRGRETAKEVAEAIEYDKWIPGQGLILTKE